jgi:hypothetical protein
MVLPVVGKAFMPRMLDETTPHVSAIFSLDFVDTAALVQP